MGVGKRSDLWQKTKGGSLPRGGITHPLGDKITAIFSPRKPNSFPQQQSFLDPKSQNVIKNSERVDVTEKKTNTHCKCHVPKTPTQNSK